jgi:hypothetical protein
MTDLFIDRPLPGTGLILTARFEFISSLLLIKLNALLYISLLDFMSEYFVSDERFVTRLGVTLC